MLRIDELEEAKHDIRTLEDYILYQEGNLDGYSRFYTMMNCSPNLSDDGEEEWRHMYRTVRAARRRMEG